MAEIIIFFPNHVLRDWPAIAARFFAEKLTFIDLVRLIHTSRGLPPLPTPGESLLYAHSSRYEMHAGEKAFFESFGKERIQGSATKEMISATSWEYSGREELLPAWSLEELASNFIGDIRTLPSCGPFVLLMKQVFAAQQCGTNPKIPRNHGWTNPPQLPSGWLPDGRSVKSSKPSQSLQELRSIIDQLVDSRPRRHRAIVKRRLRTSRVPTPLESAGIIAECKGDPQKIIEKYHNVLAGELLLWLLSEGKLLVQFLANRVRTGPNATIERSVFSHRCEAALKARAERNRSSYAEEKERFSHERFYSKGVKARGRRMWFRSPTKTSQVKDSPPLSTMSNFNRSLYDSPPLRVFEATSDDEAKPAEQNAISFDSGKESPNIDEFEVAIISSNLPVDDTNSSDDADVDDPVYAELPQSSPELDPRFEVNKASSCAIPQPWKSGANEALSLTEPLFDSTVAYNGASEAVSLVHESSLKPRAPHIWEDFGCCSACDQNSVNMFLKMPDGEDNGGV